MYNQTEDDKILLGYEIYKKYLQPNQNIAHLFDKELHFENKEMQTTYEKDNSLLLEYSKEFINQFIIKNFGNRFDIDTMWAQTYFNGRHVAHVHNNSDYSFVWYVEADPESSKLMIYNPGWPYCETHEIPIQPETGLFILFPSCLPHEVLYNHDKKRYMIGGNLTFKKNYGKNNCYNT